MMRNYILGFVIMTLVSMVFTFPGSASASTRVTGQFTASKDCQAYQSFRKQTNPGNIRLSIGKKYSIVGQNRPEGASWYQLRLKDASPRERWVSTTCGKANISHTPTSGSSSAKSCNVTGEADSYVFAVSWQPAFCEGHKSKPECSVTNPKAYQASNFTLHGLWPNKLSCGTHYGFCGKYKKGKKPFSAYDPVPMDASTLQQLGIVMPSAAHGSFLQRHEWYKHGVCQKAWNADQYFDTAMSLLQEFNDGKVSTFMKNNLGKTVSSQSFFKVIDQSFGEDAHKRLQLSCYKNMLKDVYINLPKKLSANASLETLIHQADSNFQNKCGESFKIDMIGRH